MVMLKPRFAWIGIVLFALGCATDEDVIGSDDAPVLSGPYLGQEPPGMEGRLFAPGVLSTGMDELNAVFFPGGKEVFFSLHRRGMEFVLVHMKEENGRWTKPEIAPFSGEYSDVDPAVSPDGKGVYYCSNRPRSGSGAPETNFDIWYVEKTESGWSDPVNAGAPINSDADEFYPSFTTEGTMYFQSRREGCIGLADIYRAELVDGKYETAECLPETINSPGFEGDAFIAPDESYLIVSGRREVNIGQADLYISFSAEDGSWSPLQNMGEEVNSVGGENCQILSPCGKYLFYTSRRFKPSNRSYESIKKGWYEPENGLGDIYWIDAQIIEKLRPQ
jgi:Tol biopolymer transport system component